MKNFVINLNRQPEKYELFLKQNSGTGIAFERFEASEGTSISPQDAIGMKLVVPGARFTPGAVGCGASHFRIWQQTILSEVPALVFEDDAIIRHDLNARLSKLLTAIGNWDFLTLGYNTDSVLDVEFAPGMNSMVVFNPQRPDERSKSVFQRSNSEVAAFRLHNCFGTPGYVISPAGAQKLLQLCFPMGNLLFRIPALLKEHTVVGVDGMMNRIYRSIDAFACFAPLVIPRNDNATSTTHTGDARTWS
jgi:glycosyl transferase, family 25